MKEKKREHLWKKLKEMASPNYHLLQRSLSYPQFVLTVDPPKKKNGNGNGNGNSRSPSLVDNKQKPFEDTKARERQKEIKVAETAETIPSQSKIEVSRKEGSDKNAKREGDVDKKGLEGQEFKEANARESQKEVKVTETVEMTPSLSKIEVSLKEGSEKKGKHEDDAEKKGVEEQESNEAKESEHEEAKKLEKKILSEHESATIIQSTYRGYATRRWEPLNKLRQIAKVREHADEVKKRIEEFESHGSIDEKDKAIVAETIMKLLLELDTIQGLHPSFRDVRRSVAKELIILQEKLDSMIKEKSTPIAEEVSTAEQPLNVSSQDNGSHDAISTEAQQSSIVGNPSEDTNQDAYYQNVETSGEPLNLSYQIEGSAVVETIEELSNESGLDESFKDIGDGEPSKYLHIDECWKSVAEAAEKPSTISGQIQGSEPSNESGLDESSRDICQTSEELSKELSQVESFEEDITSVKAHEEEVVPMLNEFSSVQPFTTVDDGCPVKMELPNSCEDKKARECPASTLVDSQINTTEKESEGNETVVEKAPAEYHDQPVSIESIENTTGQVDVAPNQKVEDDESEMLETDVGGLLQECIETAPGTLTGEGLEIGSEKDEGFNLQAALPQEVIQDGIEEHISQFPGVEAENIQQSEPLGIEIPISEQSEHGLEEPIVEDDTKKNPYGTQVSHDELMVGDQERSLHKEEYNGSETEAPHASDVITEQKAVEEEKTKKESIMIEQEAEIEKRIEEENEKLREMVEQMIAASREQQDLILSLNGKLKELEKKLARKLRTSKRHRTRASCAGNPSNGNLREKPMGVTS